MDHWPAHARQWALVGPPLRPSPADVATAAAALAGAGRVLLLGVTPELAPLATVAVDHSAAMIAAIHRGPGPAVRADWRALPFAAGSFDAALGDGALSNLAFPDGYADLGRELRRVLGPDGRAVLRVFARRAPAAAPGSLHALKWDLAMALARDDRNVAVAAIGAAFDAAFPDRDALAARTGWSRAVIDTIDAYRGSTVRYSFPTLDEAVAALGLRALACTPSAEPDGYPTVMLATG